MKRLFKTTAILIFSILACFTSNAQQLGQLYSNGRIRGIVVKLAPDGQPSVLMSIESAKVPLFGDKNFSGMLNASDRNDGRVNMSAIEQYKSQYGGSFPAYEWCKSLGEGWYLPAINEVYDAWVGTWGGDGELDNYNQDKYLAVNEIVKQNGGDKMNGSGDNEPLGMPGSTLLCTEGKKGVKYVQEYVMLKQSAGSEIGSMFAPKGFGIKTRKGGKIAVLYTAPHMKSGVVMATHAFYRLREDAYTAGIYEAPKPDAKVFGNTGSKANTQLTQAPQQNQSTPSGNYSAPTTQPAPASQTSPAAKQASATQPQSNRSPQQQAAPVQNAQQQYASVQNSQQQTYQAVQQTIYSNKSGYDIIVAPGQDIQCRVLKVGETDIEYKKAGFENGPTYTISRNKAEKIIYANGQVEEVKKSTFDFLKRNR